MNEFIMLCGLPGSGKSTYAKRLHEQGYKIHSSDGIRKEIFGDASNQEDNDFVFKTLHNRVLTDIYSHFNVVFDATNLSSKRRRDFLRRLKNCEVKKIAVLFMTPPYICISQDASRERSVGRNVIQRMYESFEIPYYNEGWDEIRVIYHENSPFYDCNEILKPLINFDQYNYHHLLTLGLHLLKTRQIAEEKGYNDYVKYAGLLHDIGKVETQSFLNREGVKTDTAHYYNHHNVSAYNSMFVRTMVDIKDSLHVAFLINNHMRPYTFSMQKTKDKYRIIWGEELYDEVMQLHFCDVAAH